MTMQSVLFGITGIGLGHTFRQLPLVEHFAETSRVAVFAYDASLAFYTNRFAGNERVRVIPVAVPFYVGSLVGLDYPATLTHPVNRGVDFLGINRRAMDAARLFMGTPDLVVSDYEPISAQYAYATGAPLVTLDQQSKYLVGDFPTTLAGYTYADEVERLHLFFPKADARLAVSFFDVPRRVGAADDVTIMPPVIKRRVLALRRRPAARPTALVYISSARDFPQPIADVLDELGDVRDVRFFVYLPQKAMPVAVRRLPPNVSVQPHGDTSFDTMLATCHGVIATAGHSLLSEAMFLGIPVYAIPVSPYEQHMNAAIIGANGFGVSADRITASHVTAFIRRVPDYAYAIANDGTILMRGVGQERILALLLQRFGIR